MDQNREDKILVALDEVKQLLRLNPDMYCQAVLSMKKELDYHKELLKDKSELLNQVQKENHKLKCALEQKSLELTDFQTTVYPQLSTITTKCEGICKEIFGIAPNISGREEEAVGLMETTTIRHIMELVLDKQQRLGEQVETLGRNQANLASNVDIGYQKSLKGMESLKAKQDAIAEGIQRNSEKNPATFVNGEKPNEGKERKLIRSSTVEEENRFLRKELLSLRAARNLVNGKSLALGDRNFLSALIPTSFSLVLVISNLSKYKLKRSQELHSYMTSCKYFGEQCEMVMPETREAVTIQQDIRQSQMIGLLAFQIEETPLSLFISFQFNCAYTQFYWATALGPSNVAVGVETLSCMWDTHDFKFRPDKRRIEEAGIFHELFVSSENVRVRTSCTPARKAIVSVDVWSLDAVEQPTPQTCLTDPVFTQLLTAEQWNQDVCACVITVENNLCIMLTDLKVQLQKGEQRFSSRYFLTPSSRDSLYFSGTAQCVSGVISYLLKTTDLRVAIAFWIQPNTDNRFTITLLPSSAKTDKELLNSLNSAREWSTRPDRKRSKAKDGWQLIQMRNIIVSAAMSQEPKAHIRLVIALQQ